MREVFSITITDDVLGSDHHPIPLTGQVPRHSIPSMYSHFNSGQLIGAWRFTFTRSCFYMEVSFCKFYVHDLELSETFPEEGAPIRVRPKSLCYTEAQYSDEPILELREQTRTDLIATVTGNRPQHSFLIIVV